MLEEKGRESSLVSSLTTFPLLIKIGFSLTYLKFLGDFTATFIIQIPLSILNIHIISLFIK